MTQPWSLRARVQAMALVAFAVPMTAVWLVTGVLRARDERRILATSANALAQALSDRLCPPLERGDETEVRQAAKQALAETGVLGMVIFDASHRMVVAEPSSAAIRPDLAAWPAVDEPDANPTGGGTPAQVWFRRLQRGGIVEGGVWLLLDREPFADGLIRSRLLAVLALLAAVAGGLAMASMVLKAFTRPLGELGNGIALLGQGKLETRVLERGPGGIRQLARSINRMAAELETARAEQERIAAGLDHQVRDRTHQLEQANRLLRDLAHTDPLTKLANRLGLADELARYLSLAKRGRQPLAVIMMDLDGFKAYNDSCGHPAGDIALSTVGAALKGRARGSDLVARLGGDEFCIVMPFTKPEKAVAVAEGFVAAVVEATRDLPRPDTGQALGASAGVACFPADADEASELLARADAALYRAKATGKGRVFRAGPSDRGSTGS